MTRADDFTLTPAPIVAEAVPETRAETERRLAAQRLATMHQRHGRAADGVTCRGCAWLVRYGHHDQRYLKCERYGISRSMATDWRARWQACGLFQTSLTVAQHIARSER